MLEINNKMLGKANISEGIMDICWIRYGDIV